MVCEPILMVCSVTEDSSLEVAGSHLSGALASGALDSLSGACATTREDAANKQKNPARLSKKLFFIGLLPLAKCDGSKATDPAGLYVAPHEESKEGAAPRSTHNRRLSRSTKARDIRPRSDGSCLLTENAVWPFQSCITLAYEGDDKKKTSPRPDTGSFFWTSLTF